MLRKKRELPDNRRYRITTYVDGEFTESSEHTGLPLVVEIYSWKIGKTVKIVIQRMGG